VRTDGQGTQAAADEPAPPASDVLFRSTASWRVTPAQRARIAGLADRCYRVGDLLARAGATDEAVRLWTQALRLSSESGTDDLRTARVAHEVAMVYEAHGLWEEALELYQRALDIRMSRQQMAHSDVADNLNNIAGVLMHLDRTEEALGYCRRAVQAYRLSMGETHPLTGLAMNNTAGLLARLQRNEEALELYQQALTLRHTSLGLAHFDTATTLRDLGLVHHRLRHYASARRCFAAALDGFKQHLGPNHIQVAEILLGLGSCHLASGDTRAARGCFQQSYAIFATQTQPGPGAMRAKRALLTAIHQQLQATLRQVLNAPGSNTMQAAAILEDLGKVSLRLGKEASAVSYLRKAYDLRRGALGPTHPDSMRLRSRLDVLLGHSFDSGASDTLTTSLQGLLPPSTSEASGSDTISVPATALAGLGHTGAQGRASSPAPYRASPGQRHRVLAY
jgi:tetratricopeptide (TPR) repeat protein